MYRWMTGLAVLALAATAQARDGEFFTSFGNEGREQYGFAPDLDVVTSFAGFVDVLAQPDGRLLVSATVGNTASDDFGVLRLHPNGTLDTNFGDQGQAIVPIDLGGNMNDVPTAILRQPNGRIVLCGAAAGDPALGGRDFAFARLLANGTPDTSFSGDGKATVAFDIGPAGSRDDEVLRCILQPDGKIVGIGDAMLDVAGPTRRMAVVRLNPDGSRDTGFNGSGTATIDFGASFADSLGFSARLQSDGSLVLVGPATGSGGTRWALARLDSTGQLDPGFGNGGIVLFDPGIVGYKPSLALDVLVLEDGSFVVAGALSLTASPGQLDYGVFMFDADGTPVPAFGNGGGIVIPFDLGGPMSDVPVEIDRDASGRFVVAGFATSTPEQYTIGVVRLTPGGQLDPAFGVGGKLSVATAPPPALDLGDQGTAFAFTPDGGLMVASLAGNAEGTRAGLAKVLADTVFEDGFDP
jgi:uncharacterized delta-60 repeat protein